MGECAHCAQPQPAHTCQRRETSCHAVRVTTVTCINAHGGSCALDRKLSGNHWRADGGHLDVAAAQLFPQTLCQQQEGVLAPRVRQHANPQHACAGSR